MRFGHKRIDAILKNLMVVVITIGILMLIGEYTTRLIYNDIGTTGDNDSFFARRWKMKNVQLNSWGFREKEFNLVKPNNTYRIAVIGDSITYGQGVAIEDRFSNLLEKKLNWQLTNVRHEVLNFGTAGDEIINHIATLQNIVLKSEPDFIILQWYINDFEDPNAESLPQGGIRLLPSDTLISLLHESSALYFLINLQWESLQEILWNSHNYVDHMFKKFGDPKSEEYRNAVHTLGNLVDICKSHNIPLGVILFPSIVDNLKKDYPFEFLHNIVLHVCAQEEIKCVDLRSVFPQSPDNYKNLWANRFDPHPGPFVNNLAADQLFKIFSE